MRAASRLNERSEGITRLDATCAFHLKVTQMELIPKHRTRSPSPPRRMIVPGQQALQDMSSPYGGFKLELLCPL